MALLVLALLALLGVPLLAAVVAGDGRGWRPPPSVRADQEGVRTWPR